MRLIDWLRNSTGVKKDLFHDLPVKHVGVDTVAKIMEESRQNQALVLFVSEGRGLRWPLLRQLRDLRALMVLS